MAIETLADTVGSPDGVKVDRGLIGAVGQAGGGELVGVRGVGGLRGGGGAVALEIDRDRARLVDRDVVSRRLDVGEVVPLDAGIAGGVENDAHLAGN